MFGRFSAWVSLFASTGTLLCCALPSLLVALGLGATMAGLVASVPQLVVISQYKGSVFTASGVLLGVAGILQHRAKNAPCPIDRKKAEACNLARKVSGIILVVSGLLWGVGAFFAFVAPLISA